MYDEYSHAMLTEIHVLDLGIPYTFIMPFVHSPGHSVTDESSGKQEKYAMNGDGENARAAFQRSTTYFGSSDWLGRLGTRMCSAPSLVYTTK